MAQPTKAKIRVLLVDDHAVVRMGVRAMLEATDDLVVVGEADSASGALHEAQRTRPDVVVMDVRLASESGIGATRAIRAALPDAQVLMLTSFADDEALFASVMAGAAGYVLKQIRGDDLVRGIREVGAGRSLLDPLVTRQVLDRLRRASRGDSPFRPEPRSPSVGGGPRHLPARRGTPSLATVRRR
jgi:two-component system, NarL family, response regulator DevR